MKTWFITGGTPGGLGVAFADEALTRGDRVALTTRRPAQLSEWARAHGDRLLLLPADVTDPAQVGAAVAAAEERFGGIDVLVNNAGRGWVGTVEGMADRAVRDSFELNFFAALTVLRAVLPGMRERRSGTVVNVSSVAGLVGAPAFGSYSAAKFAVEGMTEVLRHEVEPFGITVLALEPGAFRTNAYAGFAVEPIDEGIADYGPLLLSVRDSMVEQHGDQPGDPRAAARALADAVDAERPPHRLVLGGAGFDMAVSHLEAQLAGIRAHERTARGADFADVSGPGPAR
ncbi:NAD(P)-dependent dehydrogenase (short-subunit alcohol dehydrogenase family) [Catenuloplanes nepalensis]|uniref:NAD(P)-dependent dehydrogenase (Short-subunit alcohol dehydrogenase family) n=1 Tax=Catenuloplanes nepalensis TaxID=587533 RepID=A0ABT9MMN6_9ACTN|nr:SDR family NAD(P)-dependent oxidoreductase [Catenuloplanes nepalensis]MDP9792669.1 NAD(P)-dependent dehydrogenase (short-subunit alcohol dehydrogenase family) [Catenuloplanes nepalensis]